MSASAKALDHLLDRLERAETLDRVADAAAAMLRKLIRPGPIEDTLSGTPLGHPAHPMLVTVPLGAWTSALVLDVIGADEATTRKVIAFGLIAAAPAGASGASDWLSTAGAERRVGLVHAAVNYGALGLQTGSWLARRRGDRGRGIALSAAAVGLAGLGGWLGGHLAYALGVGVDTTAFQRLPSEWTDAAAESDVSDTPRQIEIDAVPVVLFRVGDEVIALADRCTHRGGPLHEGELRDGCLSCPWHGSVFAADGSVRSGPATRPQPALEVRREAGRIQVRRSEQRTLRTNPVGR